jgi:hypothetical protein
MLEIKMLIELPCLLVNRVEKNCTSSYDVRRLSEQHPTTIRASASSTASLANNDGDRMPCKTLGHPRWGLPRQTRSQRKLTCSTAASHKTLRPRSAVSIACVSVFFGALFVVLADLALRHTCRSADLFSLIFPKRSGNNLWQCDREREALAHLTQRIT